MKKIRFSMFAVLTVSILTFPIIGQAAQAHQELIRKVPAYSPELGSETISYTRTPGLSEYFRTCSPHGLAFQSIWVVANVMDETGRKYNLMREYKAADTTMTLASKEVPGLDAEAEPLFKPGDMYHGRIFHEMDEQNQLIWVKPFLPESSNLDLLDMEPKQAV